MPVIDLSVIIPSHNRKTLLSSVLKLLNTGTFDTSRFEVVVVDDGSSDGTAAEVTKLKNELQYPVKLHTQTKKGPAAARNCGIMNASGKYLLFLGDDTLPAKDLLAQHYNTLNSNDDKAAVLGFIDWDKNIVVSDFMRYTAPNGLHFDFGLIKDRNNCPFRVFYTSNISIPKKWLIEDMFDERFPYAAFEDLDLGYRLQKKGLRIIYNPSAVVYHSHFYTPDEFFKRAEIIGISVVYFLSKHPELKNYFLPYPLWLMTLGCQVLKVICPTRLRSFWYLQFCGSYFKGVATVLHKKQLSEKWAWR